MNQGAFRRYGPQWGDRSEPIETQRLVSPKAAAIRTKYIAILPVKEEPNGALPSILVPRLLRIQDAAKYLSATTWQIETLLRENVIPSFVLGKRRVVDRLELDRYIDFRNAQARNQNNADD